MKKLSLNLLTFLLFALGSSLPTYADVNPYTGAFKPTQPGYPNLIVKEVDGLYYGQIADVIIPLEITLENQLRSLNSAFDASGHFTEQTSTLFNELQLTVFNEPVQYRRFELANLSVNDFLFQSDAGSINIGQGSNSECQGRFNTYATPNSSTAPKAIKEIGDNVKADFYPFYGLNSILVLQHGELLYEQYFHGWQAEDLHPVNSVTKSFLSLMVGAAIESGAPLKPRYSIAKLIPDYASKMSRAQKKITLKDASSLASGISWPQWEVNAESPHNIINQLSNADDAIDFILNRDLTSKHGKHFNYSEADATLVGEALRVATDAEQLADVAIHGPLQKLCFKDAYWLKLKDGRTAAGFGLKLTPRDMIKIGQLTLNNGNWQGEQLINKNWLKQSTAPNLDTPLYTTYGQLWWQATYSVNEVLTEVVFA